MASTKHSNSPDVHHDCVVDSVVWHLLRTPMVKWQELVSSLSIAERQEYETTLSSLCIHAARFVGYLEARGTTGCGDSGHADGVKQSGKTAAKVRTALGFTKSNCDISF